MNKMETKQIKGFALILMFWHHIFCFVETLDWFNIYPIECLTAGASKICISIYLFCTGYGLYSSYISKETVKPLNNVLRTLKFLITYWTMLFLVAVPYLIIADKFNLQYILVNLFAIIHNDEMLYISFSWYVKLHLLILLLLPVIRFLEHKSNKIFKKHKPVKIALELLLNMIVPIILSIIFELEFCDDHTYYGLFQLVLGTISVLTRYYPLFYVGVLLNKYSLMDKSLKFINKHIHKVPSVIIGIELVIGVLIIRNSIDLMYKEHFDILLTPIITISFLNVLRNLNFKYLNKFFEFVGNYSFQYWLLSGMFFLNTSELQWILYIPKYPVAILAWKLLIITLPAIICQVISNFINDKIQKLFDILISKSKTNKP